MVSNDDDSISHDENTLPMWKKRLLVQMNAQGMPSSSSLASSSRSNEEGEGSSFIKTRRNLDIQTKPLMTFGVIADIQYAPIPDGASYSGVPRYYRHSLEVARIAATHFETEEVSCVLNLGDIFDGKCQERVKYGGEAPEKDCDPGIDAVDDVLDALSPYSNGPVFHTYGNHELYNLSRENISQKLNIPFVKEPCGDLVGYYSSVVPTFRETTETSKPYINGSNTVDNPTCSNLRFVVLDSYDIAIMQRCPDTSRKRKEAERILSANNPNFPSLENSPEGLEGVQRRYVAFNGAVDTPQLEWLRSTLQDAKDNNEKVIILSHQPILPGSSSPMCLIWNYIDVLEVLRDYKCTVIAAFAGHAHKGGYKRDEESGIHFRVFESVLESPDPVNTYALCDVHEDRLEVRGLGACCNAVYDFDHMFSDDDGAVFEDEYDMSHNSTTSDLLV